MALVLLALIIGVGDLVRRAEILTARVQALEQKQPSE